MDNTVTSHIVSLTNVNSSTLAYGYSLLGKISDFAKYVGYFVCLSVCLSVCVRSTGRISTSIATKLHELNRIGHSSGPSDFELERSKVKVKVMQKVKNT